MPMEIERKFLLSESLDSIMKRPEIRFRSEHRIEQTYLAIDEQQELRVRKIKDLATYETEFTHTFKNGNGLAREEIEISISEGIYEQLMRAHQAVPLTKNRIAAEWEGRVVEIDCYDQLELTVAEVEFDSEEEANAFVPPNWLGRDISSERQYSNKTVWRELQRNKNL
ncbi:CYTH domain-containing protein [Paenibacillus tarimensis]